MGDSSMWGRDSSGNTKLKGADGFRLIALDCRGHGKSGTPHAPEKYGPEMAADGDWRHSKYLRGWPGK